MENKFTILYVDDEVSNLHIFKDTFRREYNVLTAISAKDGLDILGKEKVDLILTDQRMPEMDGVSFLKKAIQNYPDLNRILITAYSDFDALRSAINEAQIFQYIQKPWKEDQLRIVIERALEIYHLKIENEQLSKQIKEKNKLLEKINADLVEFEKQKYEFLSTVSHEIRTPLNGLVGSIELIKSGLSPNDPESIENIYFMLESSIKKLEHFLIAAEQITFLKAKKFVLNIQKNTLKEILNKIIADLNDSLVLKRIEIITDINEETLYADKELLPISLRIIIENSIKYSPQSGKIFISSSKTGDLLKIEVNDEGEGFPKKVIDNAFQLFNKGDRFIEENVGLELSAVKMIMDEHNGDIKIQNIANSGASVQLFFKNTF